MKVGIDAASATHPQVGGYKTYVQNLIDAIVGIESSHSFAIYTDRPNSSWLKKIPDRVNVKIVQNNFPVFRHPIREQIQISQRAKFDFCELLHFPVNTGPFIPRIPYVLTLLDVISISEAQSAISIKPKSFWQWLISVYVRSNIPFVARRAEAILTVTEYEKQLIVETLNVAPAKVFVTPLAPSPTFRPFREDEKIKYQPGIENRYGFKTGFFLAIGYEPRKNIKGIIEAYSALDLEIRENHSLIIVCTREHIKNKLRNQIESRGLGANVYLVGALRKDELLKLYNYSIGLVFPSYREGFGLPPIEAMACGTPVIASNISSMPEVLEDAAILINPSDILAIKEAMLAVVENNDLRFKLIQKGLAHSRRFSWNRTARETISVYESVLSN